MAFAFAGRLVELIDPLARASWRFGSSITSRTILMNGGRGTFCLPVVELGLQLEQVELKILPLPDEAPPPLTLLCARPDNGGPDLSGGEV